MIIFYDNLTNTVSILDLETNLVNLYSLNNSLFLIFAEITYKRSNDHSEVIPSNTYEQSNDYS